MKLFLTLLIISYFIPNSTLGQSVIDDLNEKTPVEQIVPGAKEVFFETVVSISPTQRILIITNQNELYHKGDFLTLLLNKVPLSRALAAKTTNDKLGGVKILKIFDAEVWKQLKVGSEIEIVKGDDSYLWGKASKDNDQIASSEHTPIIKDEEDLYNETDLIKDEDTGSMEEHPERLIKMDNILGLDYALFQGINNDHRSTQYTHWVGFWQYQILHNVWFEAQFGQSLIGDFPGVGLDTKVNTFTFRLKYTVQMPFFSFLQPYIGAQLIRADSPGAGTGNFPIEQLQEEIDLLNQTEKDQIIFGASWLKRLVPGWFFRTTVGVDFISGGFCIEF